MKSFLQYITELYTGKSLLQQKTSYGTYPVSYGDTQDERDTMAADEKFSKNDKKPSGVSKDTKIDRRMDDVEDARLRGAQERAADTFWKNNENNPEVHRPPVQKNPNNPFS